MKLFAKTQKIHDKIVQEAKDADVELIGMGKNSVHRKYKLSLCGHVRELTIGSVRKGEFKCNKCKAYDDKAYIKRHNLEVVEVINKTTKLYKFKECGHVQKFRLIDLKKYELHCAECGQLEIVGECEDPRRKKYKFPKCGHVQEILIGEAKSGQYRCRACYQESLQADARKAGFKLIGDGKSRHHKYECLECGDVREYKTGEIKKNKIRCDVCHIEKHQIEAIKQGIELIGDGRNTYYKTYKLSCGHVREIGVKDVRAGHFRCQECDSYAWNMPSKIYLIQIDTPDNSFYKYGVGKNPEQRAKEYGLAEGCTATILDTVDFETGQLATQHEKGFHTANKNKRVEVEIAKQYLTISGFTECYPMNMRRTLINHMATIR